MIAPPNLEMTMDGSSIEMLIKSDNFRARIKYIEKITATNIQKHFLDTVRSVKLLALDKNAMIL